MSDLPPRLDGPVRLRSTEAAIAILDAYDDANLKSRDEMDEEAAALSLWGGGLRGDGSNLGTFHFRDMKRALDAAWGVDDE